MGRIEPVVAVIMETVYIAEKKEYIDGRKKAKLI